MSLIGDFSESASRPEPPRASPPKQRRDTPFAIRLSKDQRARLEREAAGAPLGTYIKAKALGAPLRLRRSGVSIEDRRSFARALAILGGSRLSSNLNQLAKLANTGSLPLTPEVEEELLAALRDVRAIRRLLMESLGLKPEGASSFAKAAEDAL